MEGPLVSDTTELLSGAAPASEDPPVGHPAAASPRSSGRSGGDLSKLLVSDLQRLAQELGISGTGRMRKGDLVAAITERTGGVRSTPKQSATRAASAGADTARPLNQDAMGADTSVRSATEAAPAARAVSESSVGGAAPVSARPAGAGETDRVAVSDRAASSDRTGITAAAQHAGLSAEQSAEAGAEAQSQGGGQDARRDRRRNGRRDDQGGNGREQRRDNREGRDNRESRDTREVREPAAAGNGRNGPSAQGGNGGQNRGDNANRENANRGDGQNRGENQNRSDNANRGMDDDDDRNGRRGRDRFRNRNRRRGERPGTEPETVIAEDDVLIPIAGILDVLENYAFVRTTGYLPGTNDVYVSLSQVRKHGLRKGDVIEGAVRQPKDGERREKFNALVRLDKVNGLDPEESIRRPEFSKLIPLYPQQRLRLETDPTLLATRIIDLISPIGKGQRGLIVSPPKAGKTMILQAIANAITKNNPECHLMVVLVDERPEEVTDMQRTVKGEVIHSTFDNPAEAHTTVAELAIERAKRLVEMGHDVVVLLDSITRLGRAYNL